MMRKGCFENTSWAYKTQRINAEPKLLERSSRLVNNIGMYDLYFTALVINIILKYILSMKSIKIELKWALIFSVMVLVWMLLEKVSGLHDKYIDYQMYLTNLFAIPAIILMVKALQDKKRNFYNGNITYMQGLISGIILSIFIALLSPLTQWVTSYVITPEYFPNVIKRSVELGLYTEEKAKAQFNYANYAKMGAIGAFIMGVITTAIAMIFIRTKPSA